MDGERSLTTSCAFEATFAFALYDAHLSIALQSGLMENEAMRLCLPCVCSSGVRLCC